MAKRRSTAEPTRAEQAKTRAREAEAATKAAASERRKAQKKWLGIAAAILVLIAALVVYGIINNSRAVAGSEPVKVSEDGHGIVVNTEPAKKDAPVVDLYVDYQCPLCARLEGTLGPTLEELAKDGDITLIRHTMTFMDGNMGNTSSTRASIGAVCADLSGPGRYSDYHAEVFKAQPEIVPGKESYSDTLLRETIPAKIGLSGQSLTDFQKCYDDRKPERFVGRVNVSAAELGVRTTPAMFRNGEPLAIGGGATPKDFKTFLLTGKAP